MVAIQHQQRQPHSRPASDLGRLPAGRVGARPSHLRVIEGGRSKAHMAAVYRRRRVMVAVVAALCVVALASVLIPIGTAVARAYGLVSPAVPHIESVPADGIIVVQPGDTLSTIARRLMPSGDIMPLVDRLAQLHGPGPLMSGDRIDVSSLRR